MRRNLNKPKLTEATTYSEAVQILNARRAPSIFRKHVDMIFKIKDETGSIKKQMLQEAENDLEKDEEEKLIGHQMNETEDENGEKKFFETEGNPSSGPEHPKPHDSGNKSGVTAQSDGTSVEDQKDKVDSSGEGSVPAQSQPGESQLKEAIEQVADMGSVDPINTATVDYMDRGLSKIEAHNAASLDNNMMEAVFAKQTKKILVPILRGLLKQNQALKEVIRAQDTKYEMSRKASQPTGMSEAVTLQNVPAHPQAPKTSRFDNPDIPGLAKEIKSKYIDEGY